MKIIKINSQYLTRLRRFSYYGTIIQRGANNLFGICPIMTNKGIKWLEGLYKAILSLENMFYRCSFAFENSFFEEEIRQLVYGKGPNAYRIIFMIVDDSVQIIFVRHAAQKSMIDESEEE